MDAEAGSVVAPGETVGPGSGVTAEQAVLDHKRRATQRGAAVWLYMIAAFTLINAVLWASEQSLRMVVGLFSTELFTVFTYDSGAMGVVAQIAVSGALAAGFAVLGWFVQKGHTRVLLVAIGLYVLDSIVYVAVLHFDDVLGLVFHFIAFFFLIGGYRVLTTRPDQASWGLAPGGSTSTPVGPQMEGNRAKSAAVPPGWFQDPAGRHGSRFWDGTAWTEQVMDDGASGLDDLHRG